MAKKPTCPYCKKEVEGKEFKKHQNRKYHIECYQKMVNEKYENSKKNDSQQELYEYVCKLFGIKELTPLINQQIRNFVERDKLKYQGILYSLKYYFEICENELTDDIRGIGIVPYIYEDAKNFYLEKQQSIKINQDKKDWDKTITKKTIKIKIPDAKLEMEDIDINLL